MSVYFTSDTHFGHANIIKYSKRPFNNVDDMDATLIRNWNSVVNHDDVVYHLGDFAVGGGPARPYINRLNGTIYFCWGNHDKRLSDVKYWGPPKVYGIDHIIHADVDGQHIVLCHYAMKVWNKSHKGAWHLYGHSHGSLPDDPNSLSLDVGVDCWNFTPVSMQQLRDKMKAKTFKPVDHHGNNVD